MNSFVRYFLYTAICVIVTSCSGDLSVSGGGGGISGTGITSGRVASLSTSNSSGNTQLSVNETILDIDSQTQVIVDEQTTSASDLKVGQFVRIVADFTNNTAERIDYVETVRGPVTAMPTINPDTLAGSLTVLGQAVTTNAATLFSNIQDVTTIIVGDIVDISGIRDANGNIIAGFIERKTPAVNEYRVVGTVTNLTATSFKIGALTIDYTAADLSGLSKASPESGDIVRVRGPAANFNNTGQFGASRISDSVLSLNPSSNDRVEVEGVVTEFASINSFEVNGLAVNGAGAIVEGGLASMISLNTQLEVKGLINNSGVLVASEIKIRPNINIRIDANIDSINPAASSLVILGITFMVDSNTSFEDDSALALTQFSLLDLSAGDRVELRGHRDKGNNLITRLERDDADDDVRLQAPVDSGGIDLMNNRVTIQGITIITDSNTDFEDANDMPLSTPSAFFTQLVEGDIVKARWKKFTDLNLPVDELSILR